jgi:cytochrome c5
MISKALTAMGLALGLVTISAQPAGLAAGQTPVQRPAAAAAAPAAPDRAIFDRYCVSCHNEKLKTGNLMLDKVDLTKIGDHVEALEKVVRKLRGGMMPPEGSRRPDKATMDAFVTSLETALDRTAAAAPNPGRVASRRLNRAEYVNAIYDLLALEVDGTELLPSDMAGFGFDNNADVLSITPGLMSRYIAAATKISRIAVASPDNRPIMQVYRVGFERRGDRSGEDLPFGTHGGLAVRHTFPLDGEYVFAIRLKRNGTVSTIDGIEEDEHQIELRVDHALVKRFTIGGKFKGPNPGVLIAVPEDDKEGQRLHDYRMNADKELRSAFRSRRARGWSRRPSPTLPRSRCRAAAAAGAASGSSALAAISPAWTCSTSRGRSTEKRRSIPRAVSASSSAGRATGASPKTPARGRFSRGWSAAPTGGR